MKYQENEDVEQRDTETKGDVPWAVDNVVRRGIPNV